MTAPAAIGSPQTLQMGGPASSSQASGSVHDRDPLVHAAVYAFEEAVVDDQGLADGLRQGLAALAEVAVDLDQAAARD